MVKLKSEIKSNTFFFSKYSCFPPKVIFFQHNKILTFTVCAELAHMWREKLGPTTQTTRAAVDRVSAHIHTNTHRLH